MSDRPPSPRPSTASPSIATSAGAPLEERVVLTTSQLVEYAASSLGVHLNEAALEDALLELDRSGYVEWTTVTRDGDYVWDLTESPERIADALAAAAVARIDAWLDGSAD